MCESSPRRACLYSLLADWSDPFDHFYATNDLEIAAETVAAAFTDNHAVTLKLDNDVPILRRGRVIWKLNTALLNDADFKVNLSHEWERWTRQQQHHPESTLWWTRFVKKKLGEGSERRRDIRKMYVKFLL